jgi:CRP/FNR family transcriptional regulator
MTNKTMQVPAVILNKKFPGMFEQELLEEMSEHGEYHEFQEGEFILKHGQFIRSIPLILHGSIKVLRHDEEGNDLILYFVKSGESCAMSLSCCMADRQSSISAIAEEDTEILAIPIEKMNEWTTRFRSWKDFVFLTYQARFDELLNAIDSIAFDKLDQRLVKYLQEKAKLSKNRVLQLTHQNIAQDLHSSREVISRLLKKMEREGQISSGRNQIELLGDWSL